jgi:hypothetical protein
MKLLRKINRPRKCEFPPCNNRGIYEIRLENDRRRQRIIICEDCARQIADDIDNGTNVVVSPTDKKMVCGVVTCRNKSVYRVKKDGARRLQAHYFCKQDILQLRDDFRESHDEQKIYEKDLESFVKHQAEIKAKYENKTYNGGRGQKMQEKKYKKPPTPPKIKE